MYHMTCKCSLHKNNPAKKYGNVCVGGGGGCGGKVSLEEVTGSMYSECNVQ